ncbi:MAG TPA: tetratricopeptide repeat protein [Verrucomicrobiae bacterium]|nr:tetratricopeptide repeat protein [Verrucomicrobiae bacterium]
MQTAHTRKRWFTTICFGLAAATFLIYLPITENSFINFDDNAYITDNPHVKAGLTWSGIVWAFKTGYAANWHPLTWISHMLDCQLFGVNPAGHHLVNVLFHTANTVLLFILLNYMTGARWRSAFVAALFAWHPLHVESVAWASERKDVLSAFFWMLSLLYYAHYARSKTERPKSTVGSPQFYALALFFFACGLLSKPMVVTLPFVLLLLDFWPLQRFMESGATAASTVHRLIIEKLPFFALSLIASVITYLVQRHGGAVVLKDSLSIRVSNALWAYERYIAKTLWPSHLAIVYPYVRQGLTGAAIGSAVLLLVCSIAVLALSRRCPYLFTGWFWFLGTLVPVIGFVEIGPASMADRYTYLPDIGLFILVTWAAADLFRRPEVIRVAAAIVVLEACMVVTVIQIKYWRNSITLFRHALTATTDNSVACACLGQALSKTGDDVDALKYCREAVNIDPNYPAGQFFLGQVLWNLGDAREAWVHLENAADTAPNNSDFQYNLGKFLLEHDRTEKAIARFDTAIKNDPEFAEAHNALGKAYLKQGTPQKAADELYLAVKLDPGNAQFHYDLGTVLLSGSDPAQAITEFTEAIRLKPDFASAHENLAIALADQGKVSDAIEHFAKAAQLEPNDSEARFNLGFAYLNNHQPGLAAEQFSAEVRLTPTEPKAHYRLAQALREQNKISEAVDEYRQTLKLAPEFADAKKELDEILAAHAELR